ncbi:MAG: helix-turn-helix domain-containing protein, partial [Thermodesulfobacteriota bacterium]
KAYERAKETFCQDSLAIYTLFSKGELQEIQEIIEEAYQVLMNEALRKEYDQIQRDKTEPSSTNSLNQKEEEILGEEGSLSFKELTLNLGEIEYRGQTLKEVRERLGIDLKSISEKTKICLKILNSIEEEDLPNLPPLVYLKSFLKSYAQILHLDPKKVVEGYLRLLNQETTRK